MQEKIKPDSLSQNSLKVKIMEEFKKNIPEVIEDGAINIKTLFDLFEGDVANEETSEQFGLSWPGKKKARKAAVTPAEGTLSPVNGEGINEDTTDNIYIEGENLEVLKILQKSYAGKIKMIYIDPPYNTGNDFVYKDDYKEPIKNYLRQTGQIDDEGKAVSTNKETSGRFHSNWLNMMYPRLKLARNLLRDDGVIFISIDDNEVAHLRKVCDEIFGEENFVGCLVWEKKKKGTFLSNTITNVKEYIYVYSKVKEKFTGLIGEINKEEETYPCINASNRRELRKIPKGIISKYREKKYFQKRGTKISVETMDLLLHSDLVIKDGILHEELIIEGNWRYTQKLLEEYANNGELYITQDLYLRRIVKEPRYKTLKDLLPRVGEDINTNGKNFNLNNLFLDGWGSNEDGEEELRLLLDNKALLDYPKPSKLIKKIIASYREQDIIILDFFSGSATTAHSVIDLNKEDGGFRKFIMVQLPELTDEKSEAFKAGYKTISDIGKERIRRVIKKIKEENPEEKIKDLDLGFKVYKLEESNFKKQEELFPKSIKQAELKLDNDFVDVLRQGWTREKLFTEIILIEGFPLHSKVNKLETITKNLIFEISCEFYEYKLIICLDAYINKETVEKLNFTDKEKFVCLDAALNDELKIAMQDKCILKTI